MRERKIFSFNSTEDTSMWYTNQDLLSSKISELRSKLSEDGTCYDGLHFSIYTDSPDYKNVWDEAKKLLLKPEITSYKIEYSKSDFKASCYFVLYLQIYGNNDYANSFQTKYREEYTCEFCKKALLKQDSELYIDKTLFGNKDIGITSNHEIVISEKMRDILEENEIYDIEFANVNHKNRNIKNDFNVHQLLVNNLMPELDFSTSFYFDPMGYCEHCRTHGQLLTSLPKYRKEDIFNAKDFNLTKEYFGGGLSGYQSIIVSKKTYDIFERNKIKGCKYDVVLIS